MGVTFFAFVMLVLKKPSNLLTSSMWNVVEYGKVKTKGQYITAVPSQPLSEQLQLPP